MLELARDGGIAVTQAPLPAHERPRLVPPGRPNLLLVANENASGIAGRRETIDRAASLLRQRGAIVQATSTASADELDALVSEEERRVVVLGGDGTLHGVANVHGPTPEVALLPFGRANNVAHALGVPLDLPEAAALAVGGRALALDGIAVEAPGVSMRAVEGVSVGFHAQARARYRSVNSADTKAGVAAAVGALAHFEPVTLAVELDGHVEVRRVGQLFVVNFPFFGPRLPVAPGADPTDGVLELVELDARGRIGLAAQFARLRRGAHLDRDGVRIRAAKQVRIATCGRSPIVADTTVLSSGPVELSARPRTIRLVVPR